MICFEVSINGRKVCTAGVGDDGVLSSILTFVKRKRASEEGQEDEGKSEGIDIRVGGIANIDPGTSERLEWLHQGISAGDEISIGIIEAPEYDPPLSREISYLECSFCGKKQSEVLKLIAGPTTYICNECVSDCTQAIVDGEATGAITLVLGKQAQARCSFCEQKSVEVERVVGTPTAHICNECIKICNEILEESV